MCPIISDYTLKECLVDLFRNLWHILNCDNYLSKNYNSVISTCRIRILINNCFLESLLLNIRFFNEFFKIQNQREDDLRAIHFLTSEEYEELKSKIECYLLDIDESEQINKTLMHPTSKLRDYEIDWINRKFKKRIFLCFKQFLKYKKPFALVIENKETFKHEDFKEVFQELEININELSYSDNSQKNS